MVQFARRTGTGTALYALKFFAKRSCYEEEVAIYRSAPVQLQRFMPGVVKYADNSDGALRCPFGNVLPPCIVMEKGESLRDRASNMPVDLYTAAQVCVRVSCRSVGCMYLLLAWLFAQFLTHHARMARTSFQVS